MSYVRHYMIEGKFLGSGPARSRIIHGTIAPPIGNNFCCPHCGRMWAECPVEGAAFMFWTKCCAPCYESAQSFEVPGSLIMEWEPELMTDFPAQVWNWELMAHLIWASQLPIPIASGCQSMLSLLSANAKRRP